MKGRESGRPTELFDDELRRWAERPPRRSGSRAAAEVMARLDERRSRPARRPNWLLAACAAVAATVIVALAWWAGQPPRPVPERIAAVAPVLELPPLEPGVALIWIDRETPLYLILTPPAGGGGE